MRSVLVSILLAALALGASAQNAPPGPFLDGRFPSLPPGNNGGWNLEPIWPDLKFSIVMDIQQVPTTNEMCVAGRYGAIHLFDPAETNPTKELLLDLSSVVVPEGDLGVRGIAFHPDFNTPGTANEGHFYVYYVTALGAPNPQTFGTGFFGLYLRLSRFYRAPGQTRALLTSEVPMIQLRLYNGSHRGGDLEFGADGMLYVAIGDQYYPAFAQDIQNTLEGGILRIDADQDPTRSHPPIRKLPLANPDEFSGQHYWIPNDNPFANPAGTQFEEHFAIGLRNPHRFTFDPDGVHIWSGDVGSNRREEVNYIQMGDNLAWPFREGFGDGPSPTPLSFVGRFTDPLVDFNRAEATSILAGYVYTGTEFPDLVGKFLCWDFVSGRIYTVTRNAQSGVHTKTKLTAGPPGEIVAMGQLPNGEVVMGVARSNRALLKLRRNSIQVPEPPRYLSQTGVFSDLATLTPRPGVIPYAPVHELYSDNAVKKRWIALPTPLRYPVNKIGFSVNGDWQMPVGTVAIKHFEIPIDTTQPSLTKRIETRFIVQGEGDQTYGATYRWNEDGKDAYLIDDRETREIAIRTPTGQRIQVWTYPSRNDCRTCHNESTTGFLGLSTRQLNSDHVYRINGQDFGPYNQLVALSRYGALDARIDDATAATYPKSIARNDARATDGDWMEAYFDVNCSNCHNPASSQVNPMDLRYGTPISARNLVFGAAIETLGLPNATPVFPGSVNNSLVWHRMLATDDIAMPPIGRSLQDDVALARLASWIQALPTNVTPEVVGPGVTAHTTVDAQLYTLIVDDQQSYTNNGTMAETVTVDSFRFYATRTDQAVTPFLAVRVGAGFYPISVIGTERLAGAYELGENTLPFRGGTPPSIILQPGETLVGGFVDARADGTGAGPGGVIPYCQCAGPATSWVTTGSRPPTLGVGNPPTTSDNSFLGQRTYAFSIHMRVER